MVSAGGFDRPHEMHVSDAVELEAASGAPPWRLNLDSFPGLVVEEPMAQSRLGPGLLWRGVLLKDRTFPTSGIAADVGPISGRGSYQVRRVEREALEHAAPIAFQKGLDELVLRARMLAQVSPHLRNLPTHHLGIANVTTKYRFLPLVRSKTNLHCMFQGDVVFLTQACFEQHVPDGVNFLQPAQAVLRSVTPEQDRSIVTDLAGRQEVARIGGDAYDVDRLKERLVKASDRRHNYLITFRGEDVGFAHFEVEEHEDGHVAWLCACIVNPELQGRGLGTRVVEALCEEAMAVGATPHLEVNGNQEAVRAIAERLGFELGGVRNGVPYYQVGPTSPGARPR